jgi:ubiquinone/menaquinone biosynthesis C-methylase UbiE
MNFSAIKPEQNVSAAFSKQSVLFDEIEKENEIIHELRRRFYKSILKHVKPGGRILELNCGTGIDAVALAQHGFFIHATDASAGMLYQLRKKIGELHLNNQITTQQISFLHLDELTERRFDAIISNFGGLNCTDKLNDVINSFSALLNEGGIAVLVVMPPVCPMELLTMLKGNFKLAFRRWKKNGTPANIEGETILSYYYAASRIRKMFGENFRCLQQQGWCSVMPMPYHSSFPKKHQRVFSFLQNSEQKIAEIFPFNCWADHVLMVMQKK